MTRATSNKLYRTFVKGLITEAGPLTYPEDATISESNCVLHSGGYRSRRLGITIEPGGAPFLGTASAPDTVAVTEFTWKSVGNDPNVNMTVIQIGKTISFTNNAFRPQSTSVFPFSIDLSSYWITGGSIGMRCQFASGKGYLFIVGPYIEPLMVEYLPLTNTITVTQLYIQIRDFKGVNDGLANDEEPTTLSNEHKYNLMNQGWIDPQNVATGSNAVAYTVWQKINSKPVATTGVISSYFTATSRYPGNNKQWWVARDSTTNAFKPSLLQTMFSGSSHAPRGHFVLEAFNQDRSGVSAVSSIPVEAKATRPTSVAFSNGRAWYGLGSTVYFSQVMDQKEKAPLCYQEADPTSEDISDLLPTDGGMIQIPEMSAINRIIPMGEGVVCFSPNGVWFIGGGAGGFTASDFSITKVSPIGTDSPLSVIHVQDANVDQLMYWSRVGIIGLQQRLGQFGKITGAFDTSIITQTTIQSFYNAIPTQYYPYVKAHYDTSTNIVQWLYNSGTCPYLSEFDSILNFDLTLKAFYPWKLETSPSTYNPYLVGVFETVTSTGLRNAFTKYLYASINSGVNYYSISEENDGNFYDWTVVPYNSYLETGYELLEDAMRNKQAMYVFTYLKRTETGYTASGSDWIATPGSSLTLTTKWNWANSTKAHQYSTPFECYRHVRSDILDPVGNPTFDTGYPIVVTRSKIRGHGKAIQFRFENNAPGKDFVLYGWSVPYSGNTGP